MNYDNFETEALIDSIPENRPLIKDSGLWSIFEDEEMNHLIISQEPNQTLRKFLINYIEFISEYENVEDLHIDIACHYTSC